MIPETGRSLEEILNTHTARLKKPERIVKTLYKLGGEATANQIATAYDNQDGLMALEVSNHIATRPDINTTDDKPKNYVLNTKDLGNP
jgi:hypothetical protein